MRRALFVVLGLALALGASIPAAADEVATVLEFESMAGVSGSFVGGANPVRGVPGGGLPWMIRSGEGQLKANGSIEVHVRGLVLANVPEVPANLRGVNPIPSFRALVSCFGLDGSVQNRSTGLFPATVPGGDSDIEASINLPTPCFAPIVFVTSPGGAWFAVMSAPIEFETMVGNHGAFSGRMAQKIQGVQGAGLPWAIAAAEGRLSADGSLEIDVVGLVFANLPEVPPAIRGINNQAFFRAAVTCLNARDPLRTGNFDATVPGGDSEIEASLALPSPCLAPIVFVTSTGGAFFAVTGF